MHDIKFIRNYPEEFEKLMRRRGLDIKSSFILEIDTSIRGYQTEIQTIQQKRNTASKEIGKLLSIGSDVSSLKLNLESYKSDLSQLDDKIKKLSKDLNDILKELPNYLDEDVPDGETLVRSVTTFEVLDVELDCLDTCYGYSCEHYVNNGNYHYYWFPCLKQRLLNLG